MKEKILDLVDYNIIRFLMNILLLFKEMIEQILENHLLLKYARKYW